LRTAGHHIAGHQRAFDVWLGADIRMYVTADGRKAEDAADYCSTSSA
jgi:hypothetical protein